MIALPVKFQPSVDFPRVRFLSFSIDRLLVERGCRADLGRIGAGIERLAGRIPIQVDDIA